MTLKIVTPDGTEVRQKLVFTEPELAEELHSNTRMIAQLRRLGAIEAIQLGNKFVYRAVDVEQFLEDFKGCDLSNEYTIAEAVRRIKKRS
jgi:hypothetical protein